MLEFIIMSQTANENLKSKCCVFLFFILNLNSIPHERSDLKWSTTCSPHLPIINWHVTDPWPLTPPHPQLTVLRGIENLRFIVSCNRQINRKHKQSLNATCLVLLHHWTSSPKQTGSLHILCSSTMNKTTSSACIIILWTVSQIGHCQRTECTFLLHFFCHSSSLYQWNSFVHEIHFSLEQKD